MRRISRTGSLEPSSALARWNADGTLDLWLPNQAPEMFQRAAAKVADIAPEKVLIHSPMLGGFFGRHFLYEAASPFPQAILLAKAVGRPVKVIWSREEEFLRDALRPMGLVRLRAGLDAQACPWRWRPKLWAKVREDAGSVASPMRPIFRWWKVSRGSRMPSPTGASRMCCCSTRPSSASGARSGIR